MPVRWYELVDNLSFLKYVFFHSPPSPFINMLYYRMYLLSLNVRREHTLSMFHFSDFLYIPVVYYNSLTTV